MAERWWWVVSLAGLGLLTIGFGWCALVSMAQSHEWRHALGQLAARQEVILANDTAIQESIVPLMAFQRHVLGDHRLMQQQLDQVYLWIAEGCTSTHLQRKAVEPNE